MTTTTFAPTSPEIGIAEFYAAQADCLNFVAEQVGSEVVDLLLYYPENQPENGHAPTTEHALRVATLMDLATQGFVSSPDSEHPGPGRSRLVLAGFLHDVAKLVDPEINKVVHNGRTLTDDERRLVSSHAPLGGEWVTKKLADKLDPALLSGIAHDIAKHHTDTPERKPDSAFVHALQVADQVDAVMLDWSAARGYKKERLTNEGLLDENGQPNPEKIIANILRGKPQRFFGLPTRRIVEIGIPLMPVFMAKAGFGSTQQ